MFFPRSQGSKPHIGFSSLETLPQNHELPEHLALKTVGLVYWRKEGLQETEELLATNTNFLKH